MKQIIILVLVLATIHIYAQDKYQKVLNFVKNNQLLEAKKIVDKWTEKENTNPKDWQYKCAVYQALFETDDEALKTSLTTDPLEQAYTCLKKSIELDTQKELLNNNTKSLNILANMFIQKGMDEYNKGEYEQSLKSFENTLEINNTPEIMNLDTIVFYNAALASLKAGNEEKAISYFKKLIVYNYMKDQMYIELANVYQQKNDKEMYEKTLIEGLEACDNDLKIMIQLINFYMQIGDTDKTIKYLEQAIEKDPYNADLYYLRAYLYESSKEPDKAIEYYEKCLQNAPRHLDANFNLGAIYYNKAILIDKDALSKTQKAEANDLYMKAISYFEKVYKYAPDDMQTVKILAKLYKFTNQEDKQKKMEDILLNGN